MSNIANRSPSATVFGIVSLTRILLSGGALIVAFLVVVRPEASIGLNFLDRIIYWSLHVGAGIAALFVAARSMQAFRNSNQSVLVSVLWCGLLGNVLVTPVFLILDRIWPTAAAVSVDGLLDQLAISGLPGALLAESIEALPWVLSSWLLLNLPVLLGHVGNDKPDQLSLDDSVQHLAGSIESADFNSQAKSSVIPATTSITAETPAVVRAYDRDSLRSENSTEDATAKKQFMHSLPGIFGSDIIAVGSDLHYLNVYTVTGKTTVLGNLRDVSGELGSMGLQVHRSHWVAYNHVTRIVNTGGEAACILSNGLRVPISRRRWKSVREYFGQGYIRGAS